MTRTVVYLGPPDGAGIVAAELGPAFRVVAPIPTPAAVAEVIGEAVAVLDASMKVTLDAGLLGRAKGLQLVVTATTGADHIDAAHLAAREIPLWTLKGQNHVTDQLTPAAELSWLLLMACGRHLKAAMAHAERGEWNRELFPGIMLNGRTLGLVGCGRIGKWMARYAEAFGMRVLGHDPHAVAWPDRVERAELLDLMARADFVSVHVPLSPETTNLIGEAALAASKPGQILINTSRGAVVDGAALIRALDDGRIAAYGCDVIEGEPRVMESELWRRLVAHPRSIVTPHIGGFSPDALGVVLRFSAQRIVGRLGT